MPDTYDRIGRFFLVGVLAALVQSIILWIVGQAGIFQLLGLPIIPALTKAWIYKRMIWGGFWALFFLLPLLKESAAWKRGLLVGLLPALATMLYFNPIEGNGFFGLNLGPMMPVVVLFFNLLWGLLAGLMLGYVAKRGSAAGAPG